MKKTGRVTGVERLIRMLFTLMIGMLVPGPLVTMAVSSVQGAGSSNADSLDVGFEVVAEGFAQPLFVTDANDGSGRLFVVEKDGTIRIIDNETVIETPFLDITDRVGAAAYEQGLLGLAFAPDYAASGLFYVNYTDHAGNTVVSRFSVSDNPNLADASSEELVLTQQQPFANHNGGAMVFGPDNYLYIGFGDGGSGGDPQGNAQSLGTWLGKILRIEVDPSRLPEGMPYSVPGDNPFIEEAGALPEIWARGLRNPWRFSFDLKTGDLWIADVGQNAIEEINVISFDAEPGQNLGWNITEGSECYLAAGCDTSPFLLPVLEYTHDDGNCSVTGGYVYRGEQMPDLAGTYVFGDYCSGLIWGGRQDAGGGWLMSEPVPTEMSISSFGEDDEGNLYVTDLSGGGVYRITSPP